MIRAFALALMALVVSIVLLGAAPAMAEPPNGKATPVYVLSVWTNDVDDQADALTQALRSRVRQVPGWSLSETNQSFETLSIALRCPPTPNQACLDRIGDQLHADHYVWGTIAKEKSGEVTAELRLWSRGKSQVEASESYSDNLKDPSDDSLRAVAGRLFAKLTSTSNTGALIVHAGDGGGSVLVDGVTKGKLDGGVARIDVPEGSHTITLRVPGFSAPAQSVTLQDGGEQEITFALTPAATATAAAPEASTDATAEHVRKKPFPTRMVIGGITGAVGVGLLVVAVVEGATWLTDKSTSDQDRNSVPNSVTDVCNPGMPLTPMAASKAQDACDQSNKASKVVKLGWIFAGVGTALLATGIVLVVGGDHGGDDQTEPVAKAYPKPKFDFFPSVGPHEGNLDVRVTF